MLPLDLPFHIQGPLDEFRSRQLALKNRPHLCLRWAQLDKQFVGLATARRSERVRLDCLKFGGGKSLVQAYTTPRGC